MASLLLPGTVRQRFGNSLLSLSSKQANRTKAKIWVDGVSENHIVNTVWTHLTLAGDLRDGPQIELAHCWSHARRKFIEAEPHYPEAGEVLERIGELYRIEREIREAEVSDRQGLHPGAAAGGIDADRA